MADWKQKWEDLGKKLREHPKLEKGLYLLIVVLALLLYFTGRSSGKENQEKIETPMATEQTGTLEERLKNTLSSIQGAGKVEVLISYESSGEIVPAFSVSLQENTGDGSSSTNESRQPVTVNGSDGEGPLVLYQKEPVVRGAVIVAEGASDITVRMNLQRAAQAVLSIPSSKIEVFCMEASQ